VQTAYDPIRIRRLTERTIESIEALARLRSTDPAAQQALLVTRLVRRNLEDLWMPLLRRIQASTALVSWSERLDDHRADSSFAALSDNGLLATVRVFDAGAASFHDDLDTDHWPSFLPELAAELARRVRADPGFATRLSKLAAHHPVVGFAVGAAQFPPSFVGEVALVMLHDMSPFDGLPSAATVLAFRHVLAEVAALPAVAFEVLDDDRALFQLASWHWFDPDTVAALVTSGLHSTVARNPTRLAAGYRVLGRLVRYANEELDDGFTPGMARGIASSLFGYIDTLGPGIGAEDGGRVRIVGPETHRFTVDLGSYEEVRNLFGAVARDAGAQATLGVVVGAYARHVVNMLGAAIDRRTGVQHVAQFADLLGDAVDAEQSEMIAAAIASTTHRRQLADLVGFGAGAASSAGGIGAVVSMATTRAVKYAADTLTEVDPDTMPNGALRHVAHDAIVVDTVMLGRTDRATQRVHRLGADRPADLERVDRYLARIDKLSDAGDEAGYRNEVSDMVRFIETNTPALDEFLTSVTDIAAVNELIEGHG
jgi:hypothetical protein